MYKILLVSFHLSSSIEQLSFLELLLINQFYVIEPILKDLIWANECYKTILVKVNEGILKRLSVFDI